MTNIGIIKNNKLDRKSGNFEPRESYSSNNVSKSSKNSSSKNKYKNQKSSIKISDDMKKKLDALKYLKKQKYDYEIIDLITDFFINNLSAQEYKRFKEYKDML